MTLKNEINFHDNIIFTEFNNVDEFFEYYNSKYNNHLHFECVISGFIKIDDDSPNSINIAETLIRLRAQARFRGKYKLTLEYAIVNNVPNGSLHCTTHYLVMYEVVDGRV